MAEAVAAADLFYQQVEAGRGERVEVLADRGQGRDEVSRLRHVVESHHADVFRLADPSVGPGWELIAIAAAVIGGVSLFGGEGRIVGVAAGAILLEFISNGLLALHISPYYQQVVQGSVLGVAILLDRVRASYFGRGQR
jgi:hypothetical protein